MEHQQLANERSDEAKKHFEEGISWLSSHRYNEAIECFNKVPQCCASSEYAPKAHLQLGYAYWDLLSLGSIRQMISHFKQGLSSIPEGSLSDEEMGFIYRCIGCGYVINDEYQNAVDALKFAVHLKPKDYDARYWLVYAYLRMDDKVEALRQYEELRKLNQG